MATVDTNLINGGTAAMGPNRPATRPPGYHRVAEVRKLQGMSLRSAARQLTLDMRETRRQEKPESDLRLSELIRWQTVLGVPLNELLNEPDAELSQPILRRAQLVRIMKTVKALEEVAESPAIRRLIETLILQMTEIMPELEHVGAWHSVGQRRSLTEFGRAAVHLVPHDLFGGDE